MMGPMAYRLEHDIKTVEDCECASEEVLAGFVPEGDDAEQLELFEQVPSPREG